jgi:LysM repeat protein
MTRVVAARRCACFFLLGLLLCGCSPVTESQSDETKDPHYIRGNNLVQQMDYQGAIEAFEQAVDANARSASAHFQLGWLFEEKAGDPAAAIYHYRRYLKLSASQDKADWVRQQINQCKIELAKTVAASGPLAPASQREMDRVVQENKDLQARVAALQSELDQARSAASARPPVLPTAPHTVPNSVSAPAAAARRDESPRTPAATPAAPRTHTVKKGETPTGIARDYGISVNALMAANPKYRPNNLPAGATLSIPAP